MRLMTFALSDHRLVPTDTGPLTLVTLTRVGDPARCNERP